ncbi:MAG: restriction endonuclease [Shewanella psychromarinicola]|uniref:restriction endonuclease n=1 Tax=Shewanella psychromarinicola TaxID=2487742 RepID=UPI003001ACC1
MAKNNGKQFELLVKVIYEEIIAQDSVESVEVKHDVSLLGKSGQEHQIDVYWSFKIGGEIMQVAIECKDYKSAVSVGRIRDFWGALDDIGNIKGIFVTTKGYQSGAITFAEHHKIALKTVQEPTEAELNPEGVIQEILVNGSLFGIYNSKVMPKFDLAWIVENTALKEGDPFSLRGRNDQIKIMDSNFEVLGTILDYENRLPRSPENSNDLKYRFEFSDGYLFAPESFEKPLKIEHIDFTYDTFTHQMHSAMNLKLTADAVLKDITTGEAFLYNKSAANSSI